MHLGEMNVEEREAEIAVGVALLSRQLGMKRVWLFGRASRSGVRLDWRSDFDFAVEGLPAGRHYGLWSELDAALKVPVDLVLWEEAGEVFEGEIFKGRLLYAKP